MLADIERTKPDLLLINMGMPLQERWLSENWTKLDVPVAITAGALVDHMAGLVKRPPLWVANCGLEWLVRLVIEPRRLWRRYLCGLPLFALRCLVSVGLNSIASTQVSGRSLIHIGPECLLSSRLQPKTSTPSLLNFFGVSAGHRLLFLTVVISVVALSAVVIEALPTRYTALASVVISPASPDPLQVGGREETVLRDDEVSTQAALMSSRDLAGLVVKRVDIGMPPGLLFPVRQRLCAWGSSFLAGSSACAAPREITDNDRITAFLSRLKATPGVRTRIIELSYTDDRPAVAAAALNALIEVYQAQQIGQRATDLSRTSSWISERAENLRQNWLQAEAKAGQFRAQSGLTPSSSRDGVSPLVAQQVASAATSLSVAQSELAAARARKSALQAAGNAPDRLAFVSMRDEPGLVALASQLAPLRVQLAEMRSYSSSNFPGYTRLAAQVASLEHQLAAETTRALRAVDADLQVKQAGVDNLTRTLAELRGTSADMDGKQVQLSTLDDEARSARTVFETFLSRAKQLDDRAGLLTSQVQFAAHATAPDMPSFPDRPRLLVGGAVLGLLFGTIAVWLREYLSRGFSNVSRIGGQLALPFLCAIPAIGARTARRKLPLYVHDNPFSPAAEAIRTLLTNFQLKSSSDPAVRTVVVTSATGQEGKTTTSIWLAGAAAQGGRRVLLIDGDHRRGAINQRLRGSIEQGFSDVLFGNSDSAQVLQRDAEQGFDFIGSGAPVSRSFGMTEVARLHSLLQQFEKRYDLIIIDTPPLLAITDALIYASLASGTVFLCRWSRTSRAAVAGCLGRLRSTPANILGIALSMVDHDRLAHFSDEVTPYDMRVMKQYYVR